MKKALSKIILQLKKITSRTIFFVRYPYQSPDLILGLRYMNLPFFFKAYKGLSLIVTSSTLQNKQNIHIDKGVWIGKDVELNTDGSNRIVIKTGSSLQDRNKIIGNVTIHRNCIFAPNVYISSGNHNSFLNPFLTIRQQDLLAPTTNLENIIEEDCWIGINAFIKAGVYMGRGSIIGANSIVLNDIAPYSVIGGNSKVIKNRINFRPSNKIDVGLDKDIPYLYRGFDHNGGFWLEDNLSIFELGNYSKIKLTFKEAGTGKLTINLSNGKFAIVVLDGQSLEANAELVNSDVFSVNQVLEIYISLKVKFELKLTPILHTLELS